MAVQQDTQHTCRDCAASAACNRVDSDRHVNVNPAQTPTDRQLPKECMPWLECEGWLDNPCCRHKVRDCLDLPDGGTSLNDGRGCEYASCRASSEIAGSGGFSFPAGAAGLAGGGAGLPALTDAADLPLLTLACPGGSSFACCFLPWPETFALSERSIVQRPGEQPWYMWCAACMQTALLLCCGCLRYASCPTRAGCSTINGVHTRRAQVSLQHQIVLTPLPEPSELCNGARGNAPAMHPARTVRDPARV